MTERREVSARRSRTALSRTSFSRPMRLALGDQLVEEGASVLDYGCGQGGDVDRLQEMGIRAAGWDPSFRPETNLEPSDVVNLGYVVNVIEDATERREALQTAWQLSDRLLVVAARLKEEAKSLTYEEPFEDGCVTAIGTFQKFFDQSELRAWIDETLGIESVPAAPGVFYVFRDEGQKQTYLASRYQRRTAAPRPKLSEIKFEQHSELLAPLIDFVANRGRLPVDGELDDSVEIEEEFGSLKRAFALIRRVTGAEQWEQIQAERAEDVLVYLALTRFGRRPRLSELRADLQADVRAFFGTYTKACTTADELLYSVGDMNGVKAACKGSPVGKKLPTALYVHLSALPYLPANLRIYEGCARSYVGVVEAANLIKLHFDKPQISYLSYPAFDDAPHPELAGSLTVPLQTHVLKYRDFSSSENPPVLHRKELFVHDSHPRRSEYAALTSQEEEAGLLANGSRIGFRKGWEAALEAAGATIEGHELVDRREEERS